VKYRVQGAVYGIASLGFMVHGKEQRVSYVNGLRFQV
jgi:hypothetical protein